MFSKEAFVMTLLEKMTELERLLGEGGWTHEMHLVDEGVEILRLLRSIFDEVERQNVKYTVTH